ncbi:MAG: c-type cytochrome, partial [Planctomycetota bacterium]
RVMKLRLLALCGIVPVAAVVGAAGGPDAEAVERGRKIFLDTQEYEYPSCAHCHATVPEDEEQGLPVRGPATTLFGSARHEGWHNRQSYKDIGTALQYCARTWQRRKKGIRSPGLDDLTAYLRSIGPPSGTLPRRRTRRPKMPDDLTGGDPRRGVQLMAVWCAGCHHGGEDAVSLVLKPNKKRRVVIARKVRGYDPKGRFKPERGTMSYFTRERLPDEDLRHILAYLGR